MAGGEIVLATWDGTHGHIYLVNRVGLVEMKQTDDQILAVAGFYGSVIYVTEDQICILDNYSAYTCETTNAIIYQRKDDILVLTDSRAISVSENGTYSEATRTDGTLLFYRNTLFFKNAIEQVGYYHTKNG